MDGTLFGSTIRELIASSVRAHGGGEVDRQGAGRYSDARGQFLVDTAGSDEHERFTIELVR